MSTYKRGSSRLDRLESEVGDAFNILNSFGGQKRRKRSLSGDMQALRELETLISYLDRDDLRRLSVQLPGYSLGQLEQLGAELDYALNFMGASKNTP